MKNNKLTEQEKQADLIDKIIYAEADTGNKDSRSDLAQGGCGVCERKGFPLFLVRKAPISLDYPFAGDSSKMRRLVKDNREPEAGLITHRYVYRTLRVGYVYILVKHKQKGWEFLGYEITPSGVYRHKSITDVKERNIKEIPQSCTKDNHHHIPGAFISIDTSVYEGEAYIAYTRRAWSQGKGSTISQYLELMNNGQIMLDLPSKVAAQPIKTDDELNQDEADNDLRQQRPLDLKTALKRFTKINLTKEAYLAPEKLTEGGKRSFAFSELKSSRLLLELEGDPNSIRYLDPSDENEAKHQAPDKLEHFAGFTTVHKFNSLRDMDKEHNAGESGNTIYKYKPCASELDKQIKHFENSNRYKVPVVIIEDPFGIAEELSLQRQLKTVPISQMLVKSEQIYNEKLNEQTHKLHAANDRLDQLLSRKVEEYSQTHANEAAIIYGEKANKSEFLAQAYYKNYHSTQVLGIPCDYFNEKRLHLRKTLSFINEYRNQDKEQELSKLRDITTYIYDLKTHESTYTANAKHYLDLGYRRIEMTEQEKVAHLAKKNAKPDEITYTNVQAFGHTPQSMEAEAKLKAARNNVKRYKLLDTKREQEFLRQDKQDYEALFASVAKHSQDYFYYLVWLFGFKEGSAYLPEAIKSYNDCEFWLMECDSNGSNNHIGYLKDFLQLINFNNLGDIKTVEQVAVWDILFTNQNSLFYHLLDGSNQSFWSLMLNKRLARITQQLEANPTLKAEQKNQSDEETLTQLLADREKDDEVLSSQTQALLKELEAEESGGKLDERFFAEKGEALLKLYMMLIARASAGMVNRPYEKRENTQAAKKAAQRKQNNLRMIHLIAQSGLVIEGRIIFYFQLEQIPLKDFSHINRYFEPAGYDAGDDSRASYQVPEASKDIAINWDMIDNSANVIDLAKKLKEIAKNPRILANGRTLAAELRAYYRTPTRVQLTYVKESAKRLNRQMYRHINAQTVFKDIKEAEFNYELNGKKAAIGAGKLMMNILQGASTQISYWENQENLNNLSIGETLRREIKRDVNFGFYKVIAAYASGINEALNMVNVSLPFLLENGAALYTNQTVSMLSNGIFKGVAGIAGFLGIVTSVISLSEGFFIIVKGHKKQGKTGEMYMWAGGLQMLASVMSILQSTGIMGLFGATLGPFGIVLFVLSLVANVVSGILLWVFKDESDEWDRMQLWFNRCLFGTWQHQDKGLPYPPTYDGMAMAINDYMAARIGLNVAIQLEASPIYHFTAMRCYKTHLENLDYYAKSKVESYEEKMREALRASCREIYMSVALPNYNNKISYYDGVLRIFDRKNNELITLNLTKGETYPILKLAKGSPDDILIQRGKMNESLKPSRKKEQLVSGKVGRVESYNTALHPKTQEKLNYFQIFYKVGEYAFLGADEVYLQIRYWPQGKTPKNGNNKAEAVKPLLMFYTYKHQQ